MSSVVLVLSLIGCTIGGEPKHHVWKTASGAEQFERLMWQAIRDKDWKEVEYHLAPTFVGVDANGKLYDRAGWIEHWKRAEVKGFTLAEVTVQPAGGDAVVTYLLRLEGVSEGTAHPAEVTRTVSVWQQLKSGWVLVATASTPVSRPEATPSPMSH